MEKTIKYIILIFILGLMILPAIQGYFLIVDEQALNGDIVASEPGLLSKESWLNGSFQEAEVIIIEEQLGFHNSLVRLQNQLNYSLFGKPGAEGIIKGKNGQYYEADYIRAWTGKDFIGEKLLDRKLRQLKFLQNHLKDSLNVDLVLILEPGKASIYPEDIPDRFTKAKAGTSNYDYICLRAEELDIDLINFNEYFLKIKDTAKYPVFPKMGTHWSEFAMWYAADSLINYIETILGIDMPEVIKEGIVISDSMRASDNDIGVTLNLLYEPDYMPMPYPEYHFRMDSTHKQPCVLAIADSYYWNFYNTKIPENLFSNLAFWYFYRTIYPDIWFARVLDKTVEVTVDDIDLQEEVEKMDVILLMMTERFLYKFDRGFVDDLYRIYGKTSSRDTLTYYQTSIIKTDAWFSELIQKAKMDKVSLGSKMEGNARYMYWLEDADAYFACYGPRVKFREIKENEAWYLSTRKNAIRKDISIDEQLMEEARYVLSEENPEALLKFDQLTAIKDSIRHDSAWYASVMNQAKHYFMTEEEIMQAEAERVWDTMVVRDSL